MLIGASHITFHCSWTSFPGTPCSRPHRPRFYRIPLSSLPGLSRSFCIRALYNRFITREYLIQLLNANLPILVHVHHLEYHPDILLLHVEGLLHAASDEFSVVYCSAIVCVYLG